MVSMMPRVLNKRQFTTSRTPLDGGVPRGAVYVGRPSKWGNPFVVGKDGTRAEVVAKYREWINAPEQARLRAEARIELRGRDLVCWCAPELCHADVLLEIANS